MPAKKDRYLVQRGDTWSYYRMVPTDVRKLDGRAPQIRIALKTDNLHEARLKRDVHERADNEFWDALKAGISAQTARERYEASLRLSAVMEWERGDLSVFQYMARAIQVGEILHGGKLPPGRLPELNYDDADPLIEAAFQNVDKPKDSVTEALDVYFEEIAVAEQRDQTKGQNRKWRAKKSQAVSAFITAVGDKPILDITRDDARKYYNHWRKRMSAGEIGHDLANKSLANMRGLFRDYAEHVGEPDIDNPFEGFKFKGEDGVRPPFSRAWVEEKFLKGDNLKGMNAEERHVFLIAVETGLRPVEIVNLVSAHIVLDHAVPHIRIAPHADRKKTKTKTSIREVPLVGVALEAMRLHPKGFPRYLDKSDSLTNAINKYLNENNLMETVPDGRKCSLYSLRHLFEDRMKAASMDNEMRRALMGHKLDRETYGSGFSLAAKAEALGKIALPFEESII